MGLKCSIVYITTKGYYMFKWLQLLILTGHAVLIVYLLYSISLQLSFIAEGQDFLIQMLDLGQYYDDIIMS